VTVDAGDAPSAAVAKKFRDGSSVQQLLAKVECLKLEETTEDRAARVAL
jgi:hypothetical protein